MWVGHSLAVQVPQDKLLYLSVPLTAVHHEQSCKVAVKMVEKDQQLQCLQDKWSLCQATRGQGRRTLKLLQQGSANIFPVAGLMVNCQLVNGL